MTSPADGSAPDDVSALAAEVHHQQFLITVTSFGRRRGTAADVALTRRTLTSFLRHAGFTVTVEALPRSGDR